MIRKYKNLIPKVPASCFIFPTAEIIGSVELGEDVIVYPGTVVRAGYGKITIPKGHMAYGIPCRIVRPITQAEYDEIRISTQEYQEYKAEYERQEQENDSLL